MKRKITPYSKIMLKILKTVPTAFASCQLQYVMDQEKCNLRLVVFIVDNIEAFRHPKTENSKLKYIDPIIEAFKLSDCIGQRGNSTKWCFNMIIACRHHIWRIMKGEFTDNSDENILLQSYVTTEKPYDLAKPVNVNDIIYNREDIFSKKVRDPQKWNDAVDIVNTILQKMENGIGDFVMQLELKDIRKSMSVMQGLILHKGLQKKSDEEIAAGAFQIDSIEQFDLSRVNLIRTLGLDNKKYYSGLSSIIPNLLHNNRKEGTELYILLSLNYFLIRCDYMEPAWDNSISISDFYETMKFIFKYNNSKLNHLFEDAIRFLFQNRLLLRSADQPQDEVPGLSLTEIKKIENAYVSGSAVKLWEELGKSSALFQLFLDDIWLDEKSDYFGDDGNDIEHCVKYLFTLQEIEIEIHNQSKNLSTERAYIEAFGTTPICKHLANGLSTSLETIITSNNPWQHSKINRARQTLQKLRRLSNELMDWKIK